MKLKFKNSNYFFYLRGDSAIGTLVQLYTGSDKKVFAVTLMVSESSASKNIVNHILDSFRIVGEPINVYP